MISRSSVQFKSSLVRFLIRGQSVRRTVAANVRCLHSTSLFQSSALLRPLTRVASGVSLSRHLSCASISLTNNGTEKSSQEKDSSADESVIKDVQGYIGQVCPGCGSAFQIDQPLEPGFLLASGTKHPQLDSHSVPEKKKAFNTDKVMSHNSYEVHLENLSPEIRERLGLRPLISADSAENSELVPEQEVLSKKPKSKPASSRIVCYRCHSLAHHASPFATSTGLPPTISPSPAPLIPKHLGALAKSKSAVIVLVVDIVDFPHSLPREIVDSVLKPTTANTTFPPVIVVGNKFDVLPTGTKRSKVIHWIDNYLREEGLSRHVKDIQLVSAKNPSGDDIKMLLKSIGKSWSQSGKGNVVLVGSENVGKSQLVNALLKEGARWQRTSAQKQHMDRRNNPELVVDVESHITASKAEELIEYEEEFTLRGKEAVQQYKVTTSNVPGTTMERIKLPLKLFSRYFGANSNDLKTKWLMDTPGVRTPDQITTLLTLDELKVALPGKMIKPTSFMLEEGRSIFLGGLVRIDCISAPERTPKLTLFTNLPLHKTSTVSADGFVRRQQQGELTVLQPPFGSPERISQFPALKPLPDLTIWSGTGSGSISELKTQGKFGLQDIVFGGLGWVMVSGKFEKAKLRVWTPAGLGAKIRRDCLLPLEATHQVEKSSGGIRRHSKLFMQPGPRKIE